MNSVRSHRAPARRRGACGIMGLSFTIPLAQSQVRGVYLKAYENVAEVRQGITAYFEFYNYQPLHRALAYRIPRQVFHEAAPLRGRFSLFARAIKSVSVTRRCGVHWFT